MYGVIGGGTPLRGDLTRSKSTERVLRHAFVVPWETMGLMASEIETARGDELTKPALVQVPAARFGQVLANGQRMSQDPCGKDFHR